jgi:RNA polymerase sigma-70 factor, ECF subfamily
MTDFTVMDDKALIELARQDPDAFAALYRRYLTPLYRYLSRRLWNPHDVEDVASQVFTAVLEGLMDRRIPRGVTFPAWLFTIARRRAVDFYRQRPVDPLEDPPSPEPGLIAAVEQGEQIHHLEHLLATLDEDQQDLLRLRFSAGLSFAEIGQIVGRSEASAKMAVYRIIENLRKQWEVENG